MKTPKFTDADRYPKGYTRSEATDVRKTIEREQKRLKAEREALQHKLISIQRKRTG